MPAKRIPQLDILTGATSATDDKVVIFDADADATKSITRQELGKGIVGDLPYTPSGGISATTVPAAIAELDTEAAKSATLAANSGSSLVGYTQGGTGASDITVQAKLRETVSVKDFGAVGDGVTDDTAAINNAMTYAIANNKVVIFDFDATIRVPTDAATLQDAVDHATSAYNAVITVQIQSGHQPATGIDVANGDWSQFRITSVDAEVTASALFSRSFNFIKATNAAAPVLACLVDGVTQIGGGLRLINATAFVEPGCGVKNVWGTGCLAERASRANLENTIWTGAAQNNTTGAGITSYGAFVFAAGADVSDSMYYGAQAAHGGVLNFDGGTANNAFRHGLRATDAGYISADGCTVNSSGVNGIYAFNQSCISARGATAINGTGTNVLASGASIIHVRDGTFTGAGTYAVQATGGSTVDATATDVSNAGQYGYYASAGSMIVAPNSTANNCGTANTEGAVRAEAASTVYVLNLAADSSSGFALYAQSSSKIDAASAVCTNAGNRAIYMEDNSELNFEDGNATGYANFGLLAAGGCRANIRGADMRKAGTNLSTDIDPRTGTIVSAAAALGGTAITVNTLTSDGVIFQ